MAWHIFTNAPITPVQGKDFLPFLMICGHTWGHVSKTAKCIGLHMDILEWCTKASVIAQLELLITKTVFLASKARSNLTGGPTTVSFYCVQHKMVSAALLDGKNGYSMSQSGKRPWVSANVF